MDTHAGIDLDLMGIRDLIFLTLHFLTPVQIKSSYLTLH